jgi:hypothetical protein
MERKAAPREALGARARRPAEGQKPAAGGGGAEERKVPAEGPPGMPVGRRVAASQQAAEAEDPGPARGAVERRRLKVRLQGPVLGSEGPAPQQTERPGQVQRQAGEPAPVRQRGLGSGDAAPQPRGRPSWAQPARREAGSRLAAAERRSDYAAPEMRSRFAAACREARLQPTQENRGRVRKRRATREPRWERRGKPPRAEARTTRHWE